MRIGETKAGHAIEDVASTQKSVTSFLAGVAQGKNRSGLAWFFLTYMCAEYCHNEDSRYITSTVQYCTVLVMECNVECTYIHTYNKHSLRT